MWECLREWKNVREKENMRVSERMRKYKWILNTSYTDTHTERDREREKKKEREEGRIWERKFRQCMTDYLYWPMHKFACRSSTLMLCPYSSWRLCLFTQMMYQRQFECHMDSSQSSLRIFGFEFEVSQQVPMGTILTSFFLISFMVCVKNSCFKKYTNNLSIFWHVYQLEFSENKTITRHK